MNSFLIHSPSIKLTIFHLFYYTHNAFNTADPSSLQDMCYYMTHPSKCLNSPRELSSVVRAPKQYHTFFNIWAPWVHIHVLSGTRVFSLSQAHDK